MRILVPLRRAPPHRAGRDVQRALAPHRGREAQAEADVLACLRKLANEVDVLAVYDDVKVVLEKKDNVQARRRLQPRQETFLSDRAHEPNIPALPRADEGPLHRCRADALMLCKDKALAKKLLSYHRIRVAVVPRSYRATGRRGASAGFRTRPSSSPSGRSRATASRWLRWRRTRQRRSSGRGSSTSGLESDDERSRGVHRGPRALPRGARQQGAHRVPAARDLLRRASQEDSPRCATAKAKWDETYRKKWKIRKRLRGRCRKNGAVSAPSWRGRSTVS